MLKGKAHRKPMSREFTYDELMPLTDVYENLGLSRYLFFKYNKEIGIRYFTIGNRYFVSRRDARAYADYLETHYGTRSLRL